MISFGKSIKTSIVIIFSIITLWITLTSCESYCDDNVGICLHANKYRYSLYEANEQCQKNESILLEIYDDKYKEVTIKALKKFRFDRGIQLLFGLIYQEGQFQWLSKREVKVHLDGMDGLEPNENCYFFLSLYQSHLKVDPVCGGMPNAKFLCLKETSKN